MHKYLTEVVIPYYQEQLSTGDNFVLYDISLKVLMASNTVLERLGYPAQNDIIGKNYSDFNHIKPELIAGLEKIFLRCLKTKQSINLVCIGGQIRPRFKNHHELIFQSYKPILDPTGQVIAVLAAKIPTINTNLFHLFYPSYISKLIKIANVTESLSTREFEVLYLLSNGLSQYEIATELNISRSTIVKTISERILPKLGLLENDSKELIMLAISLGIHGKIPKSMVAEQTLIIGQQS